MPIRQRITSLVLLASLAAVACDDPTDPTVDGDRPPQEWPVALSVIPSVPAVCGESTVTGLIADGTMPVGTIETSQDADNLYVVYRTDPGWPILRTAVFVGGAVEEIPVTGSGNPRIGRFPHKAVHQGEDEVVWQIPHASLTGEELVVAAFAEVGADAEGAWGEGPLISSTGNWSTYFIHTVDSCAAETIGSDGGVAETPDKRAILTVPTGALAEDVDITVEPLSLAELLEKAGEGAGEDGTVFGRVPVAGTFWDLGPDGLQFLTPSTIVLAYDEADLPEGLEEADLAVYVINGIFEELPSIVDPETNTISAEVGHFSAFWVSGRSFTDAPEADLEVEDISYGDAVPTIDEPLSYEITVRNNGPESSGPTDVVFEFDGLVETGGGGVLESVPEDCVERPPVEGEVAYNCPIPGLEAGTSATVEPFVVTPVVPGGVSTLIARINPAATHTDDTPGNDRLEVELSLGSPDDIDLDVDADVLPDSDPTIGGIMGFSGIVRNNGPGVSTGGTVRFVATGPVELSFEPSGGCLAVEDPTPAAAIMECDVPALAPSETFIRVMRLTILDYGLIRVDIEATPDVADVDLAPENNARWLEWLVSEINEVDLEPSDLVVNGSPGSSHSVELGVPVTVDARVFNFGPQPSGGGTLIYEVFFYDGTGVPPDATIAPECTQYRESPADVAVACFFGPAPVFGSSPPVEQFVFTPRSEGTYRIRLTAVAGERQVDVKPENNVLEDLRSVGFAQADVRLESLETTTVDPTVGQLVEVRAELGNLGPDASRSHGLVRYIIFGDVELGFFPSNCELAAASSFGPTLRCELAPLEPGETELNLRMEFTPRAAGDLTITAVVDSSGFFTLDPDGSNNIKSLTIAVAAAGPGS